MRSIHDIVSDIDYVKNDDKVYKKRRKDEKPGIRQSVLLKETNPSKLKEQLDTPRRREEIGGRLAGIKPHAIAGEESKKVEEF